MADRRQFDVLIAGGGPAAMAAACCAAKDGRRVGIVDDNPALGGQIWRGGYEGATSRRSARWFKKVQRAGGVEFLPGTQVISQPQAGSLLAHTTREAVELGYETLILAAGARERFLPFPGWTLPGVVGAGGLQSLVKSGFPISGKRVVVAGSGPLLLAVAAFLRKKGASVRLIAEQAPWGRLLCFGLKLMGCPGKLLQGAGYKLALPGVGYKAGCWPTAAEGEGALCGVTLQARGKTWTVPCDYLACGFGFVPNLELPTLLGCRLLNGAVEVDRWQETSVPGVYATGEATGVGGVDLALIEGQIAGHAIAGDRNAAAALFAARERARRFARALDRAFALRDELRQLAAPETLVCRCEDVSLQRLQRYDSWREAKMQTRCGMGPCQGRVCGSATEYLLGWKHESVRPPIFPTKLQNLATLEHLSGETGK